MATPVRELGYGDVEIYVEEILGVGSYGKVCKAKCGQLPCGAKLLHDTMFGTNDPGISKFVEQFEQEGRFLRMIKHPNIVQFLGTVRDPRSQKLALLMELMDESLTRFLERSIGPLPYHTQLNICHDVALALAYLHSNDIIHRDLSSNNVLLIGEGSRAKVTDFGMSKLIGMNPRMTPLTMCPGTHAYMPPEALITPPRYSNKLDCFSHGVLTIQIVTRQFPNPGDAHVEDPKEGSFRQVPERERRKKDIDLIDPNHPLLPLAFHCIHLRAAQRPSADELCEGLATLKGEQMYTRSVEQSREQITSVNCDQTLLQQIREKDGELAKARADHQSELLECRSTFQDQVQEKDDEVLRAGTKYQQLLERAKAYKQKVEDEKARDKAKHETEFQEKEQEYQHLFERAKAYKQKVEDEKARDKAKHETELQEKEQEYQQLFERAQAYRQQVEREVAAVTADHETELRKLQQQIREKDSQLADYKQQVREKSDELERAQATITEQRENYELVIEQLHQEHERSNSGASLAKARQTPQRGVAISLTWRRGRRVPQTMSARWGSAVVHGNTAYFSQNYSVLLYSYTKDEWTELPPCDNEFFSLAVINHKVTAIGGRNHYGRALNTLISLKDRGTKWLPPMPTPRIGPATVTTPTHLIVAGGRARNIGGELSAVEVLDTNTLQWSTAINTPKALEYPVMSLCDGYLYLSDRNKVFSCSVKELLSSCKLSTRMRGHALMWEQLADLHMAGLVTVMGEVVALGDISKQRGVKPKTRIYRYNQSRNSWGVIGEMLTPRSDSLVAALPSNELIVVGGEDKVDWPSDITEIASVTAD